MKKWKLIVVSLLAILLLAGCSDDDDDETFTASQSQQTNLTNKLNQYTQREDASFNHFEVRKDKIIITYDDADVEAPVQDAGLESVLETSYKDAQKYQKECKTKLPYEFKDKSSGTIAKSSYSGNGWFKELSNGANNDTMKFNFDTGETSN